MILLTLTFAIIGICGIVLVPSYFIFRWLMWKFFCYLVNNDKKEIKRVIIKQDEIIEQKEIENMKLRAENEKLKQMLEKQQ